MAEANYLPILPLLGTPNQKSVLVVRHDSPVQVLGDLANQTIALGAAGSATGYYLPLYDLYGLEFRLMLKIRHGWSSAHAQDHHM